MAFAGLKKQINKANQYVTEKMGGAEGTKLDMDFMEMERKTDVTVELVEELQTKTKEYLQPNPTARAKMAAVKGISKLSGQAKTNTYPQPEGLLADCMLTYGKKLGEDSLFAQALIEFGESLKQMADVKYSLDDNIKQNFLEPLHHLQTKDLKEVMHHRKKLQGRRLDFDCKRRRQAKGSHITDDEIRSAEEKFAESLHLAQMGMFNLLENDVEQISQLVTFSEALYDFHSQCAEVLRGLTETLQQKREEAEGRPKPEFTPKTLSELNIDAGTSQQQQNQTGMVGTNGGVNRHGLNGINNNNNTNTFYNNNLSGIGGINGGDGLYIDYNSSSSSSNISSSNSLSIKNNDRHYPPSRLKTQQQQLQQNQHNSHHQLLYSSQQNLSTIFNNNNNNNNSNLNNNNNFDKKTSNFTRNRVYGSHQSLSNKTNKSSKNSTSLSSTTALAKTTTKGSNNIDLDSIDWLNAWNNPPPNIPSMITSSSSQSQSQSSFLNNNNSTTLKTTTTTTTTSTKATTIKQFNNFNKPISSLSGSNLINSNQSKQNARINDPWTVPKPTHLELDNGHTPSRSVNASPLPSPMRSPAKTPATNRAPCCTALYDFEPENPGELGFKENDVIQLLNRVDENWYEGSINGRTGYFPQSYVEVVVPLPN